MSEMQIYIIEGCVAGFISVIVWAIRLEGLVKRNKEDIKELKELHKELDNKVVEKLSEIEKSLARIEGRLEKPKSNG